MNKAQLVDACRRVWERHHGAGETVQCPICTVRSAGQQALMEHATITHGLTVPAVDDIVDPVALLANALSAATVSGGMRCVGCDEVSPTVEAWSHHHLDTQHGKLSNDSPFVQPFLISAGEPSEADGPASAADAAALEEEDSEGWDEEAGDDIAPQLAQCLFCPHASVDWEAHMLAAHGLALEEALLGGAYPDEYDRLRVVNYVRDAVQRTQCPSCSAVFPSGDELCAHVQAERHYLPATAPSGDEWLMPRIQQDGVLGFALRRCGGGAGAEEEEAEEERYPDAPPLVDLIKDMYKRRQELGLEPEAPEGPVMADDGEGLEEEEEEDGVEATPAQHDAARLFGAL